MKKMGRFIQEGTWRMTDDEIREVCKEKIGVLYGFNNYGCNLIHINELREGILKEYPNTKDEDIEVWWIRDTQSIRHARFTMLRVAIPTEDFIKLRKERQIDIL